MNIEKAFETRKGCVETLTFERLIANQAPDLTRAGSKIKGVRVVDPADRKDVSFDNLFGRAM